MAAGGHGTARSGATVWTENAVRITLQRGAVSRVALKWLNPENRAGRNGSLALVGPSAGHGTDAVRPDTRPLRQKVVRLQRCEHGDRYEDAMAVFCPGEQHKCPGNDRVGCKGSFGHRENGGVSRVAALSRSLQTSDMSLLTRASEQHVDAWHHK